MIQEILPHIFHPEFTPRPPAQGDYLLCFDKGRIVLEGEGEGARFPELGPDVAVPDDAAFLFSIDERAFFLTRNADFFDAARYARENPVVLRTFAPSWQAFAGITACHLDAWYRANTYCGACGDLLGHSPTQRALVCGHCGNMLFPQISPAVIVGVVDGDRILVTRYAGRQYAKYALVAGFVEIGETFEAAIHREVAEEVGLGVKNIRYFKSQPWGFSRTLMAGFFADLDGSDSIVIDPEELAEAFWIERDAIAGTEGFDDSMISLTYDMIRAFQLGDIPA